MEDDDLKNGAPIAKPLDPLEKLGPLAWPVLLLLLIGNTINAVIAVASTAKQGRLVLPTTLFLLFILFFWRYYRIEKKNSRRRKIVGLRLAFTVAVLSYLLLLFLPYARVYLMDHGPAPRPLIDLSQLITLAPTAFAAQAPSMEVLGVYLDKDRCSFDETEGVDLSDPLSGDKVKTFQYNQRVDGARVRGACLSAEGDRVIERVLPLLKKRLFSKGMGSLSLYVESLEGYRRLMSAGGSNFLKIVFSKDELASIRSQDEVAFKNIVKWLVECVGVTEPIVTIVIRNNTGNAIVIDKAIYLVDSAEIALGGSAGALVPDYTYRHSIPHRAGDHLRKLSPLFKIEANTVGALALALRYDGKGAGRTWLMRIRVETTEGTQATTERFQLIMSKL